jgi:hypothetical protein
MQDYWSAIHGCIKPSFSTVILIGWQASLLPTAAPGNHATRLHFQSPCTKDESISGEYAMPLLLTVDIHQNANLPPSSQIVVFFNDGEGVAFPLTGPTPRQNGTLPAPSHGKGTLTVEARIGKAKPIALEVQGIPPDNAALNFNVFPPRRDKRFYIAGSIAHPKMQGNACKVTCLADGNTAEPGECIDCEDDVAIVELCCC